MVKKGSKPRLVDDSIVLSIILCTLHPNFLNTVIYVAAHLSSGIQSPSVPLYEEASVTALCFITTVLHERESKMER